MPTFICLWHLATGISWGLPVRGRFTRSRCCRLQLLPCIFTRYMAAALAPYRPAVFQVCHSWTTCLLFLQMRRSVYLSSNPANPSDTGERSSGRPEITMDRSLLAREAMVSCTSKQCCWEALGLHSLYIITQPVHMINGNMKCFGSAIGHCFFVCFSFLNS